MLLLKLNITDVVATFTPSSSLISSPHSGQSGVSSVLSISSSAQCLHTLCPQPSWTGSSRRDSHFMQEYRSRSSFSLKICLGGAAADITLAITMNILSGDVRPRTSSGEDGGFIDVRLSGRPRRPRHGHGASDVSRVVKRHRSRRHAPYT